MILSSPLYHTHGLANMWVYFVQWERITCSLVYVHISWFIYYSRQYCGLEFIFTPWFSCMTYQNCRILCWYSKYYMLTFCDRIHNYQNRNIIQTNSLFNEKVDDICVKIKFLLSRSMCILPTTISQLKVIFVCFEGNNLLSWYGFVEMLF